MSDLTPQTPAKGVTIMSEFGASKMYQISCECANPDCAHLVDIEVDEVEIQVHTYVNVHTKWWQASRWKQIWNILTKGYAEMQSTIVMDKQTVLNYASVLQQSIADVDELRSQRKTK